MSDKNLTIVLNAAVKGVEKLKSLADGVENIRAKALALAAPFAAFAVAAMNAYKDVDNANAKMAATLGITKDRAEELGKVARDVWGNNFGASIQDAADVVTQAYQQMGDVSEAALKRITEQAISLRDAFGVDTAKSIDAAKTLMTNFGMTADQAFDFIAKGYQDGLDRSGDFLESITEYSTQFKAGGATAAQFFSLMKSGLQGGMLGTDKAADAFKEFRVRILDGSKATSEALGMIGLDTEEMTRQIDSGTISVAEAFQLVIQRLRETGDESVRMRAGVGLIGTQFEDLGTGAALALDLANTKMKDLTGAAESLNAQYSSLQSIGEGLWRSAIAGALQLLDGVNFLIRSFQQMDGDAQALALVLLGIFGAGAAWQLGLKSIIGLLVSASLKMKTLVVDARAAQVAMTSTAGAMSALAAAAGVLVAVFAVSKLYEAVNAFRDMRAAQEEAAEGYRVFAADMDATIQKYDAFKNIPELPNLTGKSQEDLKAWREELEGAKVYYTAQFLKLQPLADETNLFGQLTDEAKAAREEMEKIRPKIDQINAGLKAIDAAGFEKPLKPIAATKEALDDFEKKAKEAYKNATDAARKYADEAASYEEKLRVSRLSAEDKIREIRRKGMGDAEAQADIEKQAAEKASAAKQALLKKDYDEAERLNNQSLALIDRLADEDIDAAEKRFRERAAFEQQIYEEAAANAKKLAAENETSAGGIKAQLDELAKAREAKMTITVDNLAEMEAKFKKLTEPETKTITVKTVEAKSGGGLAGFARGGFLGGYGGGDRIRALLEAGEFVLRKEAVKKYGVGLLQALNGLRLPMPALPRISIPVPSIPSPGYAAGGMVSGGPHFGTVTLQMGGQPYTMSAPVDVVREFTKAIARETRLRPNK